MGKVINQKYEILEKLDENDRLYVYKSLDLKTKRPVIIKILRKKWLSDDRLREFFNNELEIMSSLNYPNLCKVYDIDFINNVYYVVIEYFEGVTLFELVEKEAHFSVLQSINIVMQLGKVLIYSANNGVKVRNIKLTDIIVNKIGRIKVSNFSTPMSMIRKTVTPVNERSSTNSDIFFLGYILYTLIMGKFPEKMRGVKDLGEATISDEISWSLNARNLEMKEAEELQKIIESSTSMDFSKRIKKIEDMLTKLDTFVKNNPNLVEIEDKNQSDIEESNQVKDILSGDEKKDKPDDKAEAKKKESSDFNEDELIWDLPERKFEKSGTVWNKTPDENEGFFSNLLTPTSFIVIFVILLIYLLYYLKF
ncbi:protein kinase [bacterium]|nr:protein kinase [bacterium]